MDWVLLLLLPGVVVLIAGLARRKAASRVLMAMPETQIAAITDGEKVRIKGRTIARKPLRTSPVSQRPCIGFHVTVECCDGDLDIWQQVVEDQGLDSFLLADGTGEAVVHAPFEIRLRSHRETIESPSPALASLLEREGVPASEVFVEGRRFRYVETILPEGEEIIAVGHATIEIDPAGRAPSHRDPPVMCHVRGRDEVVIVANPGDWTPDP